MNGDERVRFCQSCAKSVYNLSAMTRREAQKFVALNAGKVCVRYVRLPNGKVLTADTKLHKITRRASQIAAGVFSATLTLSAITNAQTPTQPKTEPNNTVKLQNKNDSQTSQISFTVFDPINSPIPTAEVTLTNQKTKEEFTALTNNNGVAYLSFIPHGRYEVEISKGAFITSKRVIQIKEPIEPNIEISLEIGTVTGIVTIDWYEIPLFQAIAQEDNETVKNLINSGFKINTKDSRNNTALHVAVEHGNLEIVKFLLERGADVNAKNKSNLTPICTMGADNENTGIEILKLLIAKGADVNVPNEDKETLLMKASEDGSLEGVKMFLEAGANPNLRDDEGQTALMLACEDGSLSVVKALLEAGAKPNFKDEDGETALQKTDSGEIKQLLRQYGAKE